MDYLLSLAHIRKFPSEINHLHKEIPSLLWDSGAFTYYRTKEQVTIGQFVQKIQYLYNLNNKYEFITLDVIGNEQQTAYNFKKIKEKLPNNFPIFNVYYHTQPKELFLQMLEENDYLAVGGFVRFNQIPTQHYMNIAECLRFIEQSLLKHKNKRVHLLGYSRFNFNCYNKNNVISCDSTSFQAAQYARIILIKNNCFLSYALTDRKKINIAREEFQENLEYTKIFNLYDTNNITFSLFCRLINFISAIKYKSIIKKRHNIDFYHSLSAAYKNDLSIFNKIIGEFNV